MWLEILADLHVKFFVKWEFCAKVVNKSEEFRKSEGEQEGWVKSWIQILMISLGISILY